MLSKIVEANFVTLSGKGRKRHPSADHMELKKLHKVHTQVCTKIKLHEKKLEELNKKRQGHSDRIDKLTKKIYGDDPMGSYYGRNK